MNPVKYAPLLALAVAGVAQAADGRCDAGARPVERPLYDAQSWHYGKGPGYPCGSGLQSAMTDERDRQMGAAGRHRGLETAPTGGSRGLETAPTGDEAPEL